MKKFALKASLLAGLTHVLSGLTPEQKAKASEDPVGGNRVVLKAVARCEEANGSFMAATKETGERLKESYDRLKKEADALGDGKDQEEKGKIYAEKTAEYRKDAERINAESKAEPDVVVSAEVSDEHLAAIRAVFPMTVGQWQDSAAFVEVADALDAATEA